MDSRLSATALPLTVGYHKVDIEIRDQIARTTIEESFVNQTGGRLEGIFHFPLPQDASISGFGMWINGELIEADVVEKQQIVLVNFLHKRGRHVESIPILEPLVEREPNQISYRLQLITAYYRSERPEQLQELLADTERHFRQDGRWTEAVLSQLAAICMTVERFSQAVAHYEEAIALRQRTATDRGIGDGTLPEYYRQLARGCAALGETQKAVTAAAAGVVAWGPRHSQRQSAIGALRQVLAEAKDLDAYAEFHDLQAEATGQDSSLIRQQIAAVYSQRGEHQRAIQQLEVALALQPHDLQTHQDLIAAYRTLGNQQAVIKQTLALLDIDRHNLALYKDLAQQLKGDETLAERAATTLVEAAPNEAEHHQALAELRQEERRWDEAIVHWKRVAELRRLEPNGLLKLAEAQIDRERVEEAQGTIDQLNRTQWPERFGNVRSQIDDLQRRIPAPR